VIKLKKVAIILFVILFLLSISPLIAREISVKASPTIWTVDASLNDTIQEAINNASSGDTVFVRKGIYQENIVVSKSLLLIGEDIESTWIWGYGNDSVIWITANGVNITGFTVKGSGLNPYDSAIRIENSNGVVIAYNKITESTNGISLNSSNNNAILSNTIFNNEINGVYLLSSSGNVFSGNTISNNFQGVYLFSSSGNVFFGNTISNSFLGVYFTFSSDNLFYCNNFRNTNQVTSGLTNFWNFSSEGNYWSDYTGQDLNRNGIGDTPYVIDLNNQDNYPLMGMFWSFNVTWKKETYYLNFVSNSTIYGFTFKIGAETGNKIIRFNVSGEEGTAGFCRIMIPTAFMDYPFVVLIDEEDVTSTLLGVSNETYSYIYFSYPFSSHNITIISSDLLHLYSELFDRYLKLQMDLYDLNMSYEELLSIYNILLGNYTMLQERYDELNASYQEHLFEYSENLQDIQNLTYVFAGTTAIFLITTIYLSQRAHSRTITKSKEFESK